MCGVSRAMAVHLYGSDAEGASGPARALQVGLAKSPSLHWPCSAAWIATIRALAVKSTLNKCSSGPRENDGQPPDTAPCFARGTIVRPRPGVLRPRASGICRPLSGAKTTVMGRAKPACGPAVHGSVAFPPHAKNCSAQDYPGCFFSQKPFDLIH